MVIFLFLRNLSATVIPSVAVPLSLVGTFGVMYLLGYSLNNLSLMALTISTGFVVDDAIVMIENIDRLHRRRRFAAGSRAQGRRADRLHDRFADGFADRGVDSVAVHGRHRGPPVPRICGDAGGDNSGFGGGFPDADADDVRQAAEAPRPERAGPVLSQASESVLQRVIEFYGTNFEMGVAAPDRTLLVTAGTLVLTIYLYIDRAQRLFPGAGHGRDSGHFGSAAERFFPRHVRAPAGTGAGDSARIPTVESLSSFIGIDGTNTTPNSGRIQINLKPHRRAQSQRRRNHPAAAAGAGQGGGHHALYAAGAGPDGGRPRQPHAVSVHRWKMPMPRNWRSGSPRFWRSCRRCPQLRDVASDQQNGGLKADLVIDRDTASRLGITAADHRRHAV